MAFREFTVLCQSQSGDSTSSLPIICQESIGMDAVKALTMRRASEEAMGIRGSGAPNRHGILTQRATEPRECGDRRAAARRAPNKLIPRGGRCPRAHYRDTTKVSVWQCRSTRRRLHSRWRPFLPQRLHLHSQVVYLHRFEDPRLRLRYPSGTLGCEARSARIVRDSRRARCHPEKRFSFRKARLAFSVKRTYVVRLLRSYTIACQLAPCRRRR